MNKILVFFLALLFQCEVFSQSSNHSYYASVNIAGKDLDLSTSGVSGLQKKAFDNAKAGLGVGYKYLRAFSQKLTGSAGLEFKNINTYFTRPYYNNPNDINPNLSSVIEKIKFYRLAIPLEFYYNVVKKNNNATYISLGLDVNLTNRIKRTSNYKIQSPPTGYTDGTFKGSQAITFDEKSVGMEPHVAIGKEFLVKGASVFVELSYNFDISKSKIPTLRNIEYDNFYYARLNYFELKFGQIFSFRKKK